jgi:hypothetical protein
MNLKEVIQEIRTAAEMHAQIKSISIDDNTLSELENAGAQSYPLFGIEIITFNYLLNNQVNDSQVFYFNLFCLDRQQQGEENTIDCLNDTQAIITDVFSELVRKGIFNYGTNGQATVISEAAPTHTAGWLLPIQITGAFEANTCFIPTV